MLRDRREVDVAHVLRLKRTAPASAFGRFVRHTRWPLLFTECIVAIRQVRTPPAQQPDRSQQWVHRCSVVRFRDVAIPASAAAGSSPSRAARACCSACRPAARRRRRRLSGPGRRPRSRPRTRRGAGCRATRSGGSRGVHARDQGAFNQSLCARLGLLI